jgi:pimeloyl-ACP methyl ester carboxylesterase
VLSLVLANSSAGVGADWMRMQREVVAHNRRRSGPAGFAALGAWSLAARLPGWLGDVAGRRVLARVWANYFPDPTAAPPADRSWLRGAHGAAARGTVRSITGAPAVVLDDLGTVTRVPVLVVYGADDVYGPSVDAVRRRLPDARHEVLDGCGHLPWLQVPDRFSALVDDFYDQVTHRSATSRSARPGPR